MDDKLIFYYCNVATAFSILKNNEIWMTSIRNMNDANESIGVYKIFFNLLKKFDEENLNKLHSMLEFAITPGAIQIYENPLGAYPEYAVCFSKNSDSVSQWIAYADNGQGLAIGFDEDVFNKIVSKSNGSLQYQSISYISEEDVQPFIPSIYKDLADNFCDNTIEMMDRAMKQIKSHFDSGINYKTKHYESERETRLIYTKHNELQKLPDGWKIKKAEVFAKRNMLNTYIPLTFPKSIIKKIITGPNYQKNFFEVEIALEALGYPKLQVEESTSGYR